MLIDQKYYDHFVSKIYKFVKGHTLPLNQGSEL